MNTKVIIAKSLSAWSKLSTPCISGLVHSYSLLYNQQRLQFIESGNTVEYCLVLLCGTLVDHNERLTMVMVCIFTCLQPTHQKYLNRQTTGEDQQLLCYHQLKSCRISLLKLHLVVNDFGCCKVPDTQHRKTHSNTLSGYI